MKRYFLLALSAIMLAFASGSAFATDKDCDFLINWDENEDCQLSEDEFYDFYEQSNLYESLDTNNDGWVTENELGAGLYDFYDENDDGVIDEGEWEVTDDPDEEGFWDL